jgi:hypothetical protein
VAANSEFLATVPNTTLMTATVACSDGKRPVGGGFEPLQGGPTDPQPGFGGGSVFLIPVLSAPTVNGWTVTLRNSSGSSRSNAQFRVWAICAVQP